jgi:hypothetical protein
MKLLILLFITFTTPLVIFLGTVLYGGLSNDVLKEELSKAQVYSQLGDYLQKTAADPSANEGLTAIFTNRFTTPYIQTKIETAIDDSYFYITGKTTTPPVISFHELKSDIMTTNPELLTSLDEMTQEMEKMQAENPDQSAGDELLMLKDLSKHDFSFPIGERLAGMRKSYTVIRVLLPLLILLLAGSLVLLWFMNTSMAARLRWIGASLLGAGIAGLIAMFMNTALIESLRQLLLENSNELVAIYSPLGMNLITNMVERYARFQGMASLSLLLSGVICIVGMFVMKDQKVGAKKTAVVKKK